MEKYPFQYFCIVCAYLFVAANYAQLIHWIEWQKETLFSLISWPKAKLFWQNCDPPGPHRPGERKYRRAPKWLRPHSHCVRIKRKQRVSQGKGPIHTEHKADSHAFPFILLCEQSIHINVSHCLSLSVVRYFASCVNEVCVQKCGPFAN